MYFEFDKTNVRLVGSMHRLPTDYPEIPAWVNDAYRWCEVLYIEHDAVSMRPFILRKDGGSLRNQLPEYIWNALQCRWPTDGTILPIDALKPWMVMLLLAILLQPAVDGIEPHLLRLSAGSDPRPLLYLETAEEAVALFDSVPTSEIQTSLSTLLSDPGLPKRALNEIYEAWVTGDRRLLAEVAARLPFNSLVKTRSALIDKRNLAWATKLQSLLSTKSRTLICVGALHLCGPGNLIDLVGHKIAPIAV
jgi:uncharacterized protein YbaP (TraB family)